MKKYITKASIIALAVALVYFGCHMILNGVSIFEWERSTPIGTKQFVWSPDSALAAAGMALFLPGLVLLIKRL